MDDAGNGSAPHAIEAWSQYWKTGRAASCCSGGDAELKLVEVWSQFADGFDDGAQLIDLATGNGAVVKLLADRAEGRKVCFEITGVDAAEIIPPKLDAAGSQTIAFRGRTPIERLPFPDRSFDGATSQFGFEYADEASAVKEVARVLRPGGRLRFVMHAANGAVSRDIGERLRRLSVALSNGGPVTLVRNLVRAVAARDAGAEALLTTLLPHARETLRHLGVGAPADDAALFYASAFMSSWDDRAKFHAADLRRSVEDGWSNAAGVAARQQEMLRAARSETDLAALAIRLSSVGFVVEAPRSIENTARGQSIAWLVDAAKI